MAMTSVSSSATAAAPASATLPTRRHSHAFWSAPSPHVRDGPRLAVLLLNARHDSWHLPSSTASASASASPSLPRVHELFWSLWQRAEVTMCADGGANRLFDRSAALGATERMVPQYITGDLDSLRDDVRAFYAARGTQIRQDPDQDTNDLDKCLQWLQRLQQQQPSQAPRAPQASFQDGEQEPDGEDGGATPSALSVVIFGAMGGRFDQEIQNVNALFRWAGVFHDLVLLSSDTTARVLLPGVRHELAPNLAFETRTCGLLPLAGACASTRTSGLRWDLDGSQEMRLGGLVSTSNHVMADTVTVECSHPLVWTTEMRQHDDDGEEEEEDEEEEGGRDQ